MKKILAFAICSLSIGVASSAFAAYVSGSITFGSGANSLSYALSNTVYMDYSATASTGTYYTISSYHNQGTRTFSTTSVDSKIFYTGTTGHAFLTLPTSTQTNVADSTWSVL